MVGSGDRDLVASHARAPPAAVAPRAAAAVDTIAPSVAELVAASARHLLERQRGTRVIVHSSRRQLPGAARALPRPGKPS